MTAPEVGLREAVEALLDKYNQIGGEPGDREDLWECAPEDRWRFGRDLYTLLATHPSPPLPGQPGVAETVQQVMDDHVLDTSWIPAEEHECRMVTLGGQPCGCTQLLMVCTAVDCAWTGVPDGTQGDAHRAHVAAEAARALGGEA